MSKINMPFMAVYNDVKIAFLKGWKLGEKQKLQEQAKEIIELIRSSKVPHPLMNNNREEISQKEYIKLAWGKIIFDEDLIKKIKEKYGVKEEGNGKVGKN